MLETPTPPRSVLILSCSLNTRSRSHRLAQAAETTLDEMGVFPELIDLREWDLPFCNGEESYRYPSVGPHHSSRDVERETSLHVRLELVRELALHSPPVRMMTSVVASTDALSPNARISGHVKPTRRSAG